MAASMTTLKHLQKDKSSTRGDLQSQNFQEQWLRT